MDYLILRIQENIIESGVVTEGPIEIFNENEVFEQLGKMGIDKATGPDDLPIEAVKILAKQDIMYVVEAMNQVLQQGIPETWRKSRMVPIYKGKGDILECNNYRGIKLMCHSMKLLERLIEARLRQITSIDSTQYGSALESLQLSLYSYCEFSRKNTER